MLIPTKKIMLLLLFVSLCEFAYSRVKAIEQSNETVNDSYLIAVEKKPLIEQSDSAKKLAFLVIVKTRTKNYRIDGDTISNTTATYSVKSDNKYLGEVKYSFGEKNISGNIKYPDAFPDALKTMFRKMMTIGHIDILRFGPEISKSEAYCAKYKGGYLIESCDPKNPERVMLHAQISDDFKILKSEWIWEYKKKIEGEEPVIETIIYTDIYETIPIGGKYFISKMIRYDGAPNEKRTRFELDFKYGLYNDVFFFKNIQFNARIPDKTTGEFIPLNFSLKLKNVIFEKKAIQGDGK